MIDLNTLLIYLAVFFIFTAFLIALFTITQSSSILNKLISLEVVANLLTAAIAIWALIKKQPVFIDICLALALIMFLGIVAYYQFLISKEKVDA